MDLSINIHELVGLYDVHFVRSEVTTLVNEDKPAGEYEVEFAASWFPSGVYLYQLRVYPAGCGPGDFIETKKLTLIK